MEVVPHECSQGGYEPWTNHPSGRENPCPTDGSMLICLIDYIGGGSHYWTLQCPVCETVYYFDTYSFKLSQKQDIVAYAIDHGISKLTDVAALLDVN